MNELLIVLKEMLKEKEAREKNNNYEYTKEDVLALKEWLESGEITLYDLTTREYILLGISLFKKSRLERHNLCSRFPNDLALDKWIERYKKQDDNISPKLFVQFLDDAILKYGEDKKSKNKYLRDKKKRQTN